MGIVFHKSRRGTIAHFAGDEVIGKALELYGEWAEDEVNLLRPYVPKGGLVLDVGAHVGTHAIAFAEMVGEEGEVIAIEGEPGIATLLAYNVVANGLYDRVRVLAALAGAKPTLIGYASGVRGRNAAAQTFVPNVRDPQKIAPGRQMTLPVITIDGLHLPRCDLIKCDAEGMEEDVFSGSIETLQRFKPTLYFEYATKDVASLRRIHHVLKGLDYRMFWHVAEPFNPDNWKGSSVNIFGGAKETNILATHDIAVDGLQELDDPSR